MTPDQHTLVKKLFLNALDLDSEKIKDFLNSQTGDEKVIQQVLELLETYQSNTQPTQDFVHDVAENIGNSPLLFPSERYTLIKKIGQGGMGDVYLAQRKIKDIKQKVAIKILQLSDNMSKSRFSQETSILSQLSHPNISQFIDADFLTDGRPYVVMEYAEGQSITKYCQNQKLDIKARLLLFTSLCKAVEHAHRNLIIHRDIKPENILVAKDGELKLLDFGIAKIIQESDNKTKTQMHAMTPAYASPEQFMGKAVSVSSDVYSLGVLLYELLTGSRPYEPKNHSPIEFEKILSQTNPTKPSEKIAELFNSNSTTISPHNTKKWISTLSGDLDKIILKALQFDVSQRYQTVAEFLDDLQRYKNNLPVLAQKPNIGYKLKKYIQRNKLIVVSLIIFSTFIILTIQQKISLDDLSIELTVQKEELKIKEKEVQRDQLLAINVAHILSTKHYTEFDDIGEQNLIIDNTINIATGNLYHNHPIDLLVDSIPFSVTYNSDSAMQTKVLNNYRPLLKYSLGKGWNHNYSKKIDYTHICCDKMNKSIKIMIVYRADGRTIRFEERDDRWLNISPTDETLNKDGKGWILINNNTHEYYASSGQLKKISTDKNTINLIYEKGVFLSDPFSRLNKSYLYERLQSIVSDNGEQIDFHYLNNKTQIIKISNNTGKLWKFHYDLYDNLTAITFPNRPRINFDYRGMEFYNLISMISQNGSKGTYSYIQYTYDPFHRVSSIKSYAKGCKSEGLSIVYNNDYTRVVKNSNKDVSTYMVDKKDNHWIITSKEINFEYKNCYKQLNNE